MMKLYFHNFMLTYILLHVFSHCLEIILHLDRIFLIIKSLRYFYLFDDLFECDAKDFLDNIPLS